MREEEVELLVYIMNYLLLGTIWRFAYWHSVGLDQCSLSSLLWTVDIRQSEIVHVQTVVQHLHPNPIAGRGLPLKVTDS